jgi:hypothetical protein
VTGLLAVSATLVAWLGAATVAVSDGRRAIALGLCVTGIGLAVLALLAGDSWGAVALLVGGAAAGALRLREGLPGWDVMPPGSTPRIILSLGALAAGAFVGIYLISGPGAPGRVAALAVCGLCLTRLLSDPSRVSAVAAVSALSLALGTMGSFVAEATGAAVAIALSAISSSDGRVAAEPTSRPGVDG